MPSTQVPTIFSEQRRVARALRSEQRRSTRSDAATFLIDAMADDMVERLSFVRHAPRASLVIGACTAPLADHLSRDSARLEISSTANPSEPLAGGSFEFIGVLGQLDAVNDLPGALIHLRQALAPNGLVIASFIGGQSLPVLRAAMFAAEPDRPAARMHPLVDPRAAPQLLQRAGWKDPVVDSYRLTVRYPGLDRLVADLRDSGLGNALARPGAPFSRAARARARDAFMSRADADGKVAETFEIITLTGHRSRAGT